MENLRKTKNKKNPLVWIIFAVILPLIITLVLLIVILSFAGVNVLDWAKEKGSQMPVVSTFIEAKEERDLEIELADTNEQLQIQKGEAIQLEQEIEELQSVINDLTADVNKYKTLAENNDQVAHLDEQDEAEIEHHKKIASSFRKMDSERAADIVQNLDNRTATSILIQLSGEVRGDILAEMDPKRAAELTTILLDE